MTMTPNRGLIAGAVLLGLVVVIEAIGGEARLARISAPPPAARTHAASPLRSDNVGVPAALDNWVRIALSRPLMTMTRQPAASAGGSGLADNGLPRLAGTIVSDDQAIAIFAAQGEDKPLIVHSGSLVGPYRIKDITADSVTVDGPDGKQVLHPQFGAPFVSGYSNMPGRLPNLPPPGMTPGLVRPPIPPRPNGRNAP